MDVVHLLAVLWTLLLLVCRHATANDGSVDIVNETSSQVVVHCKSGDNDLGNIYIEQFGDYYFHFGQNIFGTTFFYCTFRWGEFTKIVPVWKGKAYVDRLDCEVDGQCVWKVTERGFYWAKKGPLEAFYFYGDWLRAIPSYYDPPTRPHPPHS